MHSAELHFVGLADFQRHQLPLHSDRSRSGVRVDPQRGRIEWINRFRAGIGGRIQTQGRRISRSFNSGSGRTPIDRRGLGCQRRRRVLIMKIV